MAYTRDWDETQPGNHLKVADIPDRIRKVKIDVAERLKAWIYGFISGETQEGLKRAPLVAQSSAPGAESGKGIIYAKEVSGVVELFFKDSNGNEVQLTENGGNVSVFVEKASPPSAVSNKGFLYVKEIDGKTELFFLNDAGEEVQITLGDSVNVDAWQFRSGDLLFSSNTTAPPGWTDVSTTYENKFIRISSGTPLTTGGNDTHSHSGSVGDHTLTIDEIPPHYHLDGDNRASSYGVEQHDSHDYHEGSAGASVYYGKTSTVGGGQPHSHPLTIASAENIPAYVQVRVYKKD